MPVPFPRITANDSINDYIGKCAGDDGVIEHLPDQEQRVAACANHYRDTKKKHTKDETFSLDAEVFAVGTWNGMPFEKTDLNSMAAAFNSLADVHKVPLKFGHNDDQPMTDGQPAIGWVDKVWVEAGKLMAHFTDLPKVVYHAIEKKLYNHVSVELDMGVEHKGSYYPWVLSGVALLGADIPAVNTLSDLQAYMSRDGLRFSKRLAFTAVSINNGGSTMTTEAELQAQLDAERAKNKALSDQNATFSKDKVELEGKIASLEADKSQRDEADKKAKFSAAKDTLVKDMDDLVKAKVITPAQREKYSAGIVEGDQDSLERVRFAVNVAKEGSAVADPGAGSSAQNDNSDESGKSPDTILVDRTHKYMRENNVSFSAAKARVMEQDPQLAAEYRDMNGTSNS